jgi:hypothetical protein
MTKTAKVPIKGPRITIREALPRHLIVKKVVNTFIRTEHKKKGKSIRFRYPVEVLPKGEMLYIVRPGHKKNFDFKVEVVSDHGFGEGSHKEIAMDMRRERKKRPQKFTELMARITQIYNCTENDVDALLKKHRRIENSFRIGGPVEILLKVLKWLFIMEDIVYWDNEGRAFLFNFLRYVSQERREKTLKEALINVKNPDKLKSFMKKSGIEWIPCNK